jgi:hypothetical protein
MTTKVATTITGLLFLIAPMIASADSTADLSAQIQLLLTKISAFQSQGAVLQSLIFSAPTVTP